MEMVYKLEDGILVIDLPERIDATNAADAEAEIERIREQGDADVIRFDASGMNYISSAGLRILKLLYMALRKKDGELEIKSANKLVMEIFEMYKYHSLE